MKNKIKTIREKVSQVTTLPNGLYNGVWGGYNITVRYGDKDYELETEVGVKGISINVVVQIIDGVATFDCING